MNSAEFQLYVSHLILNMMTDAPTEVTGDSLSGIVFQREKVV